MLTTNVGSSKNLQYSTEAFLKITYMLFIFPSIFPPSPSYEKACVLFSARSQNKSSCWKRVGLDDATFNVGV